MCQFFNGTHVFMHTEEHRKAKEKLNRQMIDDFVVPLLLHFSHDSGDPVSSPQSGQLNFSRVEVPEVIQFKSNKKIKQRPRSKMPIMEVKSPLINFQSSATRHSC